MKKKVKDTPNYKRCPVCKHPKIIYHGETLSERPKIEIQCDKCKRIWVGREEDLK